MRKIQENRAALKFNQDLMSSFYKRENKTSDKNLGVLTGNNQNFNMLKKKSEFLIRSLWKMDLFPSANIFKILLMGDMKKTMEMTIPILDATGYMDIVVLLSF